MWRNFVQKERNDKNIFSEIIMDMGKYFPCKWGKSRLFQESFQKIPPEESNRHYVEKLCAKGEK
jgi:hypothetical protein